MFQPPHRLLAGLLLIAAAAVPTAFAASADDLTKLRGRIADVQKQLERDQSDRDQLAREMQDVERRVGELGRDLRELREQVKAQKGKVEALQKEQAEGERELVRRTLALSRQMRAAYLIGRNGQTQMLLNLDDAQKVGRVLVYYDYLQRAQTSAIQAISTRAAELERIAERLAGESERLETARKEQEAALRAMRQERGKRADVLQQLRQRIADESGELKRLQADERSLRGLIESVRETLAELPPEPRFSDKPFATQRGKLPWPARGKLLAAYGQPKAGGRLNWNGHWIAAAEGAAVHAVARGRVAYVGWMHRYGLIVLVEHEGGYYSLYGHAQAASVAIGDTVRAGQVLATAGTTGGHEQPGVYFELRKGTEPINPKQWLSK